VAFFTPEGSNMLEYRLWFAVLKLAIKDYARYIKNGKDTKALPYKYFVSASSFIFDGASPFDTVCKFYNVDPDRLRAKIKANPHAVSKAISAEYKPKAIALDTEHFA
jgi:hypothetical protein